MFRATDDLDQRIQLLADATDPGSVGRAQGPGGPARERNQGRPRPAALRGVSAAPRPGLSRRRGGRRARPARRTPPRRIYAINLAALAEQNRIRGDTNLTADQKSIELKQPGAAAAAGQHRGDRAGIAAGTAARAAAAPAEKGLCPRPG